MCKLRRTVLGATVAAVVSLVLATMLTTVGSVPLATAWADPPPDQTYTGAKRCASCHFEQYMKWKKTKHAKTFELLTDKYEKDAKCLQCHTTGYGEPTGFKDLATTPALAGTTCETCHGPGSKHEEVSKPFTKVKNLTPEQEELLRGSIWRMIPKNICIDCHKVQGHGESPTPPELRGKS